MIRYQVFAERGDDRLYFEVVTPDDDSGTIVRDHLAALGEAWEGFSITTVHRIGPEHDGKKGVVVSETLFGAMLPGGERS